VCPRFDEFRGQNWGRILFGLPRISLEADRTWAHLAESARKRIWSMITAGLCRRGSVVIEETLILTSQLQCQRLEPGQGDPELEWQLSLHPKCEIGVATFRRLSSPCRFFRLQNIERAAGGGSRLPASSLPCRLCKAGHLGLVRGRRWHPNYRWHGLS